MHIQEKERWVWLVAEPRLKCWAFLPRLEFSHPALSLQRSLLTSLPFLSVCTDFSWSSITSAEDLIEVAVLGMCISLDLLQRHPRSTRVWGHNVTCVYVLSFISSPERRPLVFRAPDLSLTQVRNQWPQHGLSINRVPPCSSSRIR